MRNRSFLDVFCCHIPRGLQHKQSDGNHSFATMSDYSASPSDHHSDAHASKRKATQAGLDGHTTGRSVKRRASKACQCCRARKVRCNVTEHGAPCTNCRLDEVECIVSESRRKKLVALFFSFFPLFTWNTRNWAAVADQRLRYAMEVPS